MNKFIIVLCSVLAVAYAGEDHVDNYFKLNRGQYQRLLDSYDFKMVQFREHYKGRVETVAGQKEYVVTSIVHTEERYTPLELLNGLTKQCIQKYRGRVASVEVTKQSLTQCEVVAITELTTLLAAAVNVRNALEKSIKTYEQEVAKCGHENYTDCVSDLTAKANKFTYENEKSFEYELEAAECLAKAHVKKVVDCHYTIQLDVLATIGQVDALVWRCINPDSDCKPCEKYTCAEAADVYGSFNDKSVANPLYGRSDNPKCLLLNVH